MAITRTYHADTTPNGVASTSTERGALNELLATLPYRARLIPVFSLGTTIPRQYAYPADWPAQIVLSRTTNGATSHALYAVRPDGSLDLLGYIELA